ncbi:major facilitator family transporter [Corallococcus coralloides]|uniref:Major facilitator family transporter n=1 Tax=Corallococcus coralloides TaxID=184914 RepID=A0A410RMP7_CORCK|nr:MFS transporter [Corallococcus coralloides]QAT83106.1 major facilitator family transporter [Corallococcus coralloides]
MRRIPSRLWLLCALYFVQGLPFGFQVTALPVYLRTRGVSLAALGFAGALSLPWMLKALWAPLVDRYGSARLGRRRSWILPMQAGLALACAGAAFAAGQDSLPLLLGLIFVMNLFAATQDIAVDGFAVDLLRPEELGPGNTAQVVGYKVGMLTGGGLLVWASASIGWSGLFLVMSALCLTVFTVVLFVREPPPREAEGHESPKLDWPALRARIRSALTVPGTGWLLLFIGTYKLGETMSDVLYKPFLVDAGFTPARIGLWVGTWGTAASLLGSMCGGLLAARLPLLRAVALTGSLRLLPLAGRWLLTQAGVSDAGVLGVTLAEEFFGGALTTVMFAFMMSRTDRRIGATHYTLLASVEVAGKAPAGPLAGLLADPRFGNLGYGNMFLLGVALSAAFLALLAPLRRNASTTPAAQPAS